MNSIGWLEQTAADARHAVRLLIKHRAFAIVTCVTLALGIGATSAMFSVVNAVLLRPLPFPDDDRLVRIAGRGEQPAPPPSADELLQLRSVSRALTDVHGFVPFEVTLQGIESTSLQALRVSPGLLPMLGARPVLGRLFVEDDRDAIVLSETVWDRYFARSPDLVGRRVLSADRQVAFTVVGVVADRFHFPNAQTHAWARFSLEEAAQGGQFVANIAKLREGVSVAAASSELATLAGRITRSRLRSPQSDFQVNGFGDDVVADVRPTLYLLAFVVAVLLLIACANVANLFLAQAISRQREVAVRVALGAGRSRLLRQMLTETLLITCLSGALGLVVAAAGLHGLRMWFTNLSPPIQIRQVGSLGVFPRIEEIALDMTTFAVAAVLCVVTAVFAGVVPMFRYTASVNAEALREGVASAAGGFGVLRRLSTRSVLVVSQVTLATILLTAGGLLLTTFVKLLNVEKGYDSQGLVVLRVRTPQHESVRERRRFADQFAERLRAIPGVTAASYAHQIPLAPVTSRIPLRVRPGEDLPPLPDSGLATKSVYLPDLRRVGPGYLDAMGTAIVSGRAFAPAGVPGGGRVVLINETLARGRFPGENPVGRHVYLGGDESGPWEIIGVVEDVRQWGLDLEPDPQIFVDLSRWPDFGPADTPAYYVVRSTGDDEAFVAHVREALRRLDPDGVPENILRMDDLLSSALAAPRMRALLFGLFAALGLTLATVGIYGVMAYTVGRSTRELAVRLAMGARAGELLRMVLRRAGALAIVGVLLVS